MLAKMAWRNLWRNRRRTLITVISVAFGVWLSVTFTGVGGYMYTKMIDTSAKMGMGHVTLQARGYQKNPQLKIRLKNAQTLAAKVRSNLKVRQAVARIQGSALFATARKSIGGAFMAIDPAAESPDSNIFIKNIIEGKLFKNSNSRGAVIGSGLARRMKLKVGKRLIYTFTNIHGDLSSGRVKVSGIYKTGVDDIDTYMVLLPLERVAAQLGYAPGSATQVAIELNDQRDTLPLQKKLQIQLSSKKIEVLTYSQTQAQIAGMVAMDKSFNYTIQFILGLLISVGIFNTLLMSVLERKQEFGVMMAVGMSPKVLFGMVLSESLCIGILGLLVGGLLSAPWYYFMTTVGLDFTSMAQEGIDAGGVPIDLIYKLRLFPEHVAVISLVLLTLTALAGLFPAYKAGRISPVESIRDL